VPSGMGKKRLWRTFSQAEVESLSIDNRALVKHVRAPIWPPLDDELGDEVELFVGEPGHRSWSARSLTCSGE
jgi:hypothetical protein